MLTDLETEVVRHLKVMLEFRRGVRPNHTQDQGFLGIDEVVLRHGRTFAPPPKALPYGLKRGEIKQCFANSQRALTMDWFPKLNRLTYVEGYALCHIPIHHGWLVDNATGQVVDLTLRKPSPVYIGVPFKTEYVMDIVQRTAHWTALLDNWASDPVQPIIAGAHPVSQWLCDDFKFGEKLS